jgi:hypothetical protein
MTPAQFSGRPRVSPTPTAVDPADRVSRMARDRVVRVPIAVVVREANSSLWRPRPNLESRCIFRQRQSVAGNASPACKIAYPKELTAGWSPRTIAPKGGAGRSWTASFADGTSYCRRSSHTTFGRKAEQQKGPRRSRITDHGPRIPSCRRCVARVGALTVGDDLTPRFDEHAFGPTIAIRSIEARAKGGARRCR